MSEENRFYLATLNGEPVGWGGEQLLYASEKKSKFWNACLYTDLRKLKRHIKKSIEFRIKNKYSIHLHLYSWVVVEVGNKNE